MDNFSEVLPNVDSIEWQDAVLPILNLIGQVVWPTSNSFVFGEWLFGTSQHIIIQEYVRILDSLCVSNICPRNFILAVSLIDCYEMYKASEIFFTTGLMLNFYAFRHMPLADASANMFSTLVFVAVFTKLF